MSEIVIPTDLYIDNAEVYQVRFDVEEVSEATGQLRARVLGPPRWGLKIGAGDNVDPDQANAWEKIVIGLRGRVNYASAYDPGRRVPRGTMRGTPTLSSGINAGAVSMVLNNAVGTLKPGDWLQIGTGLGTSMLVKVMDNVTAVAGSATVPFEPPSRYSFAGGTSVIWDHPRAYYRAVNSSQGWSYQAGAQLQGGFNLDLLEVFL